MSVLDVYPDGGGMAEEISHQAMLEAPGSSRDLQEEGRKAGSRVIRQAMPVPSRSRRALVHSRRAIPGGHAGPLDAVDRPGVRSGPGVLVRVPHGGVAGV